VPKRCDRERRDRVNIDLSSPLGLGGLFTALGLILGALVKLYIDKRSADREEVKTNRQSESGIVETTRDTLRLVREEMQHVRKDMAELRAKNQGLERIVEELTERVRILETENARLRDRLPG
jgi:DNA repair exonuclease SbcCD ATPase subunit